MKDDLEKYINRRKRADSKFAENFESGYQVFKVGVLLRQAREEADIGLRSFTVTDSVPLPTGAESFSADAQHRLRYAWVIVIGLPQEQFNVIDDSGIAGELPEARAAFAFGQVTDFAEQFLGQCVVLRVHSPAWCSARHERSAIRDPPSRGKYPIHRRSLRVPGRQNK